MPRPTILIAPADAIPLLQSQPYLRESRAFAETQTNEAIQMIRDQLPPIIAVERNFAATLTGQGLLKRIKNDVNLRTCEIEMVGVRRAQRHKVPSSTEITIDDSPAKLLDISTTGAHVDAGLPLKPKQRIRLLLRTGERPLTGIVVWAKFELPAEGPRYRAGIEFLASATNTVAQFISELA